MGDLNVRLATNRKELNEFTRHLLKDVHALERMLEEEWFNEAPIHIGAEQEICIVDNHFKPAPLSMELLEALNNPAFTTELAKFNIEANLDPLEYKGHCFSSMEQTLSSLLSELRQVGESEKVDFALTGILPTIRKFDLEMENLTPLKRYKALIDAIEKLRGKFCELHINGMDELNIKHDSAMLESCNTSFQVHLQVRPDDFVGMYNIAQVLTAPCISIACNSPMLFGKRLWAETRVALFQQSIDTRQTSEHLRDRSPRVTFGNGWLEKSIVDLYKEDIARFRILLMTDSEDDVTEKLNAGTTPSLRALMIHNSTVYRWNRGCYGVSPNGKPHLRIENRVLPSGPSVIDEVANAAFWIGLMTAFKDEYPDISQDIEFDCARDNFMSACRDGLNTSFRWIDGRKISATELIKEELIPMAKSGLESANVDKGDIDRYMDVIESRNETGQTGTQWTINSQLNLQKTANKEEILISLTAAMIENQKSGRPVHEWKLAEIENIEEWHPYSMLVEEFMTTDVFTVHENDLPELVSDIMVWRKIKYLPVEDEKGRLKGLITFNHMLEFYAKDKETNKKNTTVKVIMDKSPVYIHPEATVNEALRLMKSNKVDCLPVVKNNKLVGIITEGNFLHITASLLNNIEKQHKLARQNN
ncbi:MAG: CBS domain-containing protein [Cyclobacteriaceae bacterium]